MKITRSSFAKTITWALIAGFVTVSFACWACRNPGPDKTAAVPPEHHPGGTGFVTLRPGAQLSARLAVSQLSLRPIEKTLVAPGRVTVNQNQTAKIYPLARGIVEQVLVQLGDSVESGAPLLQYDSIELGELLQEFRSAQVELERAIVHTEVTRGSLSRAESLFAAEAISRKEYALREAEHRQALYAVRGKEVVLEQLEGKIRRHGIPEEQLARLRSAGMDMPGLTRSVLKAPFAGVIIKLAAARGEIVETDREVITLTDLSDVWVLADIYEKDLRQIREGQRCRVLVPAYPGEIFAGEITHVGSLLDAQTRTGKLRCEVRNPDKRLKPEMFASVEIPFSDRRMVAAVPREAVQNIGSQTVVFVQLGNSRFQKREVELGEQFGDWWEVRRGLAPSEKIVTGGAFYLKSALLSEEISGGGAP